MLNLGNMDNNCYILGDDKSKHALLIDAPAEAGAVLDVLEEEGLKLKFILLTHCHYDHIGALDELCEATGAEVMIHAFEMDGINDPTVNLALTRAHRRRRQPQRRIWSTAITLRSATLS